MSYKRAEEVEDTIERTKNLPHKRSIKISKMPNATTCIKSCIMVNNDSLSAAHLIKQKNPNARILVLNFANNDSFCDRKFAGSTQEENIVQRTSLFHCMTDDIYPISSTGGYDVLLTKQVSVIKDNMYNLIEPFTIDIITCAALANPRQKQPDLTDNLKYDYQHDDDKTCMKNKIQMILKIAGNYDVFITGAWGMGAFGNPEYGLIKLWNEEITKCKNTSNETNKSKLTVIFAIVNKTGYMVECFNKNLNRFH